VLSPIIRNWKMLISKFVLRYAFISMIMCIRVIILIISGFIEDGDVAD